MDGYETFNGKGMYKGYTVKELQAFVAEGRDTEGKMTREIERRAKVAAGDMSAATGGERITRKRGA